MSPDIVKHHRGHKIAQRKEPLVERVKDVTLGLNWIKLSPLHLGAMTLGI